MTNRIHGWITQPNEEDLICQSCGAHLTISELDAMPLRDERVDALYGEHCPGRKVEESNEEV